MIQSAIQKLIEGKNLVIDEAEAVMEEIMTGKATDSQIAGFLVALRMKGETIDEITALAKVMREKAHTINPKTGKPEDSVKCTFILSKSGIDADVYSTAIFVSGFEKGIKLSEEILEKTKSMPLKGRIEHIASRFEDENYF